MKSILIISLSYKQNDSRVARQIEFLKAKYTITTHGNYNDSELESFKSGKPSLGMVKEIIIAILLLCSVYEISYKLLHRQTGLKNDHGEKK
jgi:hypothetical protein